MVSSNAWFAIRTNSRHERKVAVSLEEKGVEIFLPMYTVVRQWSDRQVRMAAPMFPGYVFVRLGSGGSEDRVSVLRTFGVIGFVGLRGMGAPIPEDEIGAIKTVLREKIPFTVHPALIPGQKVRIRGGSLDGVQGVLTSFAGDESLIISVESIQQSLALRISGYRVEAA
jgi:transcription antitermination factor NusG